MKRGTTDHPKFHRFRKVLGCSWVEAVGILEGIWMMAGRHCPQGNVGKFSDQEIADYLHWSKSAGKLISALLAAGWLDQDSQHRLVIHDWVDHLDQSVDRILRNKGLDPLRADNRTDIQPDNRTDSPTVVPSEPIRAEPIRAESLSLARSARVTRVYDEFFNRWWEVYPRKVSRPRAEKAWRKQIGDDRELAATVIDDTIVKSKTTWANREVEFIPYPATYLNDRGWQDVVRTPEDERKARVERTMALMREEEANGRT